MKKLLIITVAALLLGGCIVYPGYDYGYYGYPYPYAYAGPSVDVFFPFVVDGHGHGGFHGGFRH